jgi:zinc transport system ATP-binding protein
LHVTEPVVRLRDAVFGYRGVVAARADLEIAPGEVVAVLGPNGSGKSTLIKGMLGLIDCYGGDVEWFGSPLGRFSERWRIGYVPQRQLAVSPIPVTVEELVRSGRVARTGVLGRYRVSDRRAVAAAINTVGLADQRRVPVGQLSGGQQRRALVARGLGGGADVLLLDEPLAGVDRENQQALTATFTALVAGGATLLVVLHELGPLDTLVTRTVSLAAGEVVYDGPATQAPPELVAAHGDVDPHGGAQESVPRLGLFPR